MFSQLWAGRLRPGLLAHSWPGTQQLCAPGMTRLLRAVGSALGQERFVLLTHFVKVAMKWPWRGSPGFQ